MPETRYKPNHAGIAALARDPLMSAVMLEFGKRAQHYAESIAPRESGKYASSFVAAPYMVSVHGEMRAGAIVVNDSPYAAGVEWRNNQHVLARAATYVDGKSRFIAFKTGRLHRTKVYSRALRRSRGKRARRSQGV